MPIYEYKCLEIDCNHKFELLVNCISNSDIKLTGQVELIHCPVCKQNNVKRVISVIANTPNKWKV